MTIIVDSRKDGAIKAGMASPPLALVFPDSAHLLPLDSQRGRLAPRKLRRPKSIGECANRLLLMIPC